MNSTKYKFSIDPETKTMSSDDAKKYFSCIGFAVFAVIVSQQLAAFIMQYLASYILNNFFPAVLENSVVVSIIGNLISVIAIYCISMPLFLFMTRRLPKISPDKGKMGFGTFLGGLCVSWYAMMVGSYLSSALLTLIESALGITTTNPVAAGVEADGLWITLIFACIIAPIMEEIFFRKIVCDRLLPLGESYAVFLSAAIFGLIHQNFYQFAYAFFIGAIFALIYVKTGKLWYTMVYHSIINFLGAIVSTWVVSLVDTEVLMEIYENGAVNYETAELINIMANALPLLIYSTLSTGLEIAGIVLFMIAAIKRKVRFDDGLLPPPRKQRAANLFCNVGVAAAITAFVATFILSLVNF